MCRGVPAHVNPTWTGFWYYVLIFCMIGYGDMNYELYPHPKTSMTACYRGFIFIGWWQTMTWYSPRHISHANFCVICYVMMWCLPYISIIIILISSENLWVWRFEMSLFLHHEVVKNKSHFEFLICSQSLTSSALVMLTIPPKAKGAIILSLFTVCEVLPILMYLSWSNGNAHLNMSHFKCIESSQIIEFCNPFVKEFMYQQLYSINHMLTVTSWLQLLYQGFSMDNFRSSWECLKSSKSIPSFQ